MDWLWLNVNNLFVVSVSNRHGSYRLLSITADVSSKLVLNQTFIPQYNDPNSAEYQTLAKTLCNEVSQRGQWDYCDVIIGAMASQITSLSIVCSTVYSGADQRKHQSSASMAFLRGIYRWPMNPPHKRPVMFPFHDVIMMIMFCPILQTGQVYADQNVTTTSCAIQSFRWAVEWINDYSCIFVGRNCSSIP